MNNILIRMLPDMIHVRHHWFCRTEAGPAETPSGHLGPYKVGGVRGYIACQKSRESITPLMLPGGQVEPLHFTDDARAATCPECQATPEFEAMMAQLEKLGG
jgi:hypothetical protein